MNGRVSWRQSRAVLRQLSSQFPALQVCLNTPVIVHLYQEKEWVPGTSVKPGLLQTSNFSQLIPGRTPRGWQCTHKKQGTNDVKKIFYIRGEYQVKYRRISGSASCSLFFVSPRARSSTTARRMQDLRTGDLFSSLCLFLPLFLSSLISPWQEQQSYSTPCSVPEACRVGSLLKFFVKVGTLLVNPSIN